MKIGAFIITKCICAKSSLHNGASFQSQVNGKETQPVDLIQ